jgi:hypothetical protein
MRTTMCAAVLNFSQAPPRETYWGERSAARSCRLYPQGNSPDTHWTAGLDGLQKSQVRNPPDSNLEPLSRLVRMQWLYRLSYQGSHNTDYNS